MSSPTSIPPNGEGDAEQKLSKKAAKKEAAKAEKAEKKRQQDAAAAAAAAAVEEVDLLAGNYGDVPLVDIQSSKISGRVWTGVEALNDSLEGQTILIRGRAQTVRAVSKKMAFLVVRESGCTVQCLLASKEGVVSMPMVKYASALNSESVVDVEGLVFKPDKPITGASQQVELHVRKLYCVSRSIPTLPINIEDASRSEIEFLKAEESGKQLVRVGQDTRLNYRVLDIRTPANQGIFHIESEVIYAFSHFLRSEGFRQIKTPKLMGGTSEGGAAVFRLDYKGQPACLAQSPQLHKQMVICGDFKRVFEVGAVYRAEDSYTHRHLCEFTGLDVEMEIKEHYSEVMDIVDRTFVKIFDLLNHTCKRELDAVNKQYPFEPLLYLDKTLRLTFEEGVQMLKDAGVEIDPFGDLNTESERKLGQLVKEKFKTDFFILYRYPLTVRPFYTMPCPDDHRYSNSFDVFIRGEEIISGAQRVHIPELLATRAESLGIDVKTISTYIDSFRYGAPPHGGFGAGMERVVMLFLGLNNIRKSSLFPRDPQRLAP